MQWNNNIVVRGFLAFLLFIFSLAVSFYTLNATEPMISAITDPVYKAIAFGGLIIVLISLIIVAPVLTIIATDQ